MTSTEGATTIAQSKPRRFQAPDFGPGLGQIIARMNADQEYLARTLGAVSAPQLKAWVRANPESVRKLLSAGANDPQVILPLVIALRSNSTASCFDGDPIEWFATYSGYDVRQSHQLLQSARWLYTPAAMQLGPQWENRTTAERTGRAREIQRRLQDVFARTHASVWVINICRDQTRYLCAEAKELAGPIIERVLELEGPYPSPTVVFKNIQQAVHDANRAYKPTLEEHSYLKFSPVRHGMVAIKGFCTASQAETIRRACRKVGGNEAMTDPKKMFKALHTICADTTAEAAPATVSHRVNVVITAREYDELATGRRTHAAGDLGQKVAWQKLASQRLNPVDTISIIGENGTRHVEAPGLRYFSPEQRERALVYQIRCAHPGCETPARQCQAHHMVPVSRGGLTTSDNLILVCDRHHPLNDDTHEIPGRFHYAKDKWGIPYRQDHPQAPGQPTPKPKYNQMNLNHSAVARALNQNQVMRR